jgi:hypothetical protein
MFTISVRELGIPIDQLIRAKSARIVPAIQTAVQLYVPRYIQEEIAIARPRPPVDRGTYRRQWLVQNIPDGVRVYNPTVYAGVIEKGRRPGTMPPVDPLESWVRRKGIARNVQAAYRAAKKVARASKQRTPPKPPSARSIAFAIALSMKKHGWPRPPNQPMRILEKAFNRLKVVVKAAVEGVIRAT